MNFGDIQRGLEIGVNRTDISDMYGSTINEVRKLIQQRRSWTFMNSSENIVWKKGDKLVKLPDNFKEFTSTRAPVCVINDEGSGPSLIQLNLLPKSTLSRYANSIYTGYSTTRLTSGVSARVLSAYLDFQNGQPTLNFFGEASNDVTLTIDYYGYLPNLVNKGDTDVMLQDYPDMILNKAKAKLFELINSEGDAQISEQVYEKYYSQAAQNDSRRRIQGIRLQM